MILDVKKNDDGEYTIQIDNKYNSSTWTHPEISITLEIEIDGNVTKFNEKNGNFNLGKNWKNGTYNATHFYFSSNPKLIANKTNKGTRIKDTFTLSEADTSAGTIEGEERFGSSIPNSFNLSLEGDFADAFSLTAKSYANELRANNNQKLISELTFLRHRQNWLIVTQEIGRRFGSKSLEAPEIKKLSGFIDASIKALAGLKTRNISFFVKTDTEKIALDTATLILAYNVSFEPKKENPISAVAKDLDPPKETVLEITKEEEDKEAALAKETIRITRMINENEKAITNLLTLLQDKSTRDEHLPSKANIVSSQLNLLIKKFNELNTEFQTEAKLIDSENEFAAPKQLMVNIERLKVKFISDKKIFKNTRIIPDLWSEKFKEDIDYIDLNKLIKKAIKEFENYETTIKKISGVSNEKDIDDINEKLKRVVNFQSFNIEFESKLRPIPDLINQASKLEKPETVTAAIKTQFFGLEKILFEYNKNFQAEFREMTELSSEINAFVKSVKTIIKVEKGKSGFGFRSSGSLYTTANKLVDYTREIGRLKERLNKQMQE